MKKAPKLLLLCGFTFLQLSCSIKRDIPDAGKIEGDTKSTRTLEFQRTKVIPLVDTLSGYAYEIYLRLPENYDKNTAKEMPVIYYTDALWHMEILSGATDYLLNHSLLVGISWQTNIEQTILKESGIHYSRYRDYSFTKSKNERLQFKYQFGQAKSHLDFIEKYVITYVEKNYGTAPDKRTYFGYSLGGVFGTYILFSKPKMFTNYILGSPAFQTTKSINNLALNLPTIDNDDHRNVYVSYGLLENKLGKRIDSFVTLLNKKDWQVTFEKHPGNHKTAFPFTGLKSIQWLSEL